MLKEVIGRVTVEGRALPIAQANRAGDFLFVSGQLPLDGDHRPIGGDMASQTRRAILNLERVAQSAGASLEDVVKISAFLTDKTNFAAFNSVYDEYFGSYPPARCTVVVGLLVNVLVELDAIIYCPPLRAKL
jgi:2-iminobutanoate/2-iminopropanoate deaminase